MRRSNRMGRSLLPFMIAAMMLSWHDFVIKVAVGASSAQSSTFSHASLLQKQTQASQSTPSQTSSLPKTKHETIVSGYGSSSQTTTIFEDRFLKRLGRIFGDIPINLHDELWVKHDRLSQGLHIKIKSPADDNDDRIYRIRAAVGTQKDWDVQDESSFFAHMKARHRDEVDDDEWRQVDGIYGVYELPSGFLWVFIAKTAPVYSAPTWPGSAEQAAGQQSSWFNIRKVVNLELMHMPDMTRPALSEAQKREEQRQLQLLRKAFKEHAFYYCSSGARVTVDLNDDANGENGNAVAPVVPDMTRSVQYCINKHAETTSILSNEDDDDDDDDDGVASDESHHDSTHESDGDGDDEDAAESSSSAKYWWEQRKDAWPDARFFWNQVSLEPLVAKLQKEGGRSPKHSSLSQLLKYSIPLTSAFVGVQRNITTVDDVHTDTIDNANNEGSSKVSKKTKDEPALHYDQVLISRRSRFRAGTRFTVRGADATGAVANYAETEQLSLLLDGSSKNALQRVFSFVQTRGSVPLRWSSPTDIKTYRPRIRIGTDPLAQARAFRLHLAEQVSHYVDSSNGDNADGDDNAVPNQPLQIVFVNLIDKHSDQGRLGDAFDAVLRAVVQVYNGTADASSLSTSADAEDVTGETEEDTDNAASDDEDANERSISKPDISGSNQKLLAEHLWFDFHAEVKGGRWDKLGNLLDQLKTSLQDHGFFSARPPISASDDWHVEKTQRSVIRTNCMDCLDRTNVVQSILGRYMLFQQLSSSDATVGGSKAFQSAFKKDEMTLPWTPGELSHRLLWADNADAISQLYAGTPALKRDFTRLGKRTKKGALDDGMNSAMRFYLNNFHDSDRQEGMDLMVGLVEFSEGMPSEDGDGSEDDPDGGNGKTPASPFAAPLLQDGPFGPGSSLMDMFMKSSQGTAPSETDQKQHQDEPRELDLRWLPGDLQNHVRSQVMPIDSSSSSLSSSLASTASGWPTDDRFSSTRALEAMDKRAQSNTPWWAVDLSSDNDDDSQELGRKGNGQDGGMDRSDPIGTSAVGASTQLATALSTGALNLTPGYLVGMLIAGTHSPVAVASAVVAILGAVYLPSILMEGISSVMWTSNSTSGD